jgi:hypothetical protein
MYSVQGVKDNISLEVSCAIKKLEERGRGSTMVSGSNTSLKSVAAENQELAAYALSLNHDQKFDGNKIDKIIKENDRVRKVCNMGIDDLKKEAITLLNSSATQLAKFIMNTLKVNATLIIRHESIKDINMDEIQKIVEIINKKISESEKAIQEKIADPTISDSVLERIIKCQNDVTYIKRTLKIFKKFLEQPSTSNKTVLFALYTIAIGINSVMSKLVFDIVRAD